MRILHLSKFYYPYRGGIEKVIQELAEAAVRQGHEVTVICSSEDYRRHDESIHGVRVIRWPRWMSLFSQPITPAVFFELKKFIHDFDVVQIHTPNPMMEYALLKFELKVPLIVTYHCEVLRKTPLNRFYESVSKRVLEKAQSIVVATSEHLQYSQKLKKFKRKCTVVPFGIAESWSHKTLEMNQRVKEIKETYGRYFLFIGRMVTYKGVNILLEAIRQTNCRLVLIGKGPLLQDWKRKKSELLLDDRVFFLDQVESDLDFAAYIHGSDAIVLPSITEAEAFGMVLLEAMACSKPLITTDLKSGVRFVNKNGFSGLAVEPCNAQALTQAMNKMAQDDSLRLQMGQNARQHFEENFTLEKFVNSYMQIYAQLTGAEKAA